MATTHRRQIRHEASRPVPVVGSVHPTAPRAVATVTRATPDLVSVPG
jgi:hypothetical protein